jgi:hypothetical protein
VIAGAIEFGNRAVTIPRPEAYPARKTAPILERTTAPDAHDLAATSALLTEGGDSRLTLDPATGLNRYGCAPRPDPRLSDFGSSTASVISTQALGAADHLRWRLSRTGPLSAAVYARELDRIRDELKALCGLSPSTGADVIFAASGTDLHLLVRELVGGTPSAPLLCVGVEPEETGSGAPAALAGRHFSTRTALGETVVQGAAIGPGGGDFVAVRSRAASGALRDGALVEADLDAIALSAASQGRRVLLTVADVSKTGLIAPGLNAVLALRRRFPRSVEVLIDACQFRLSPASLQAYLDNDLMVAMTGSKFLTGPVFCGALFVPPATAKRMRGRLLTPALRAYSARAEWPHGWVAGAALNEVANEGLLLRWEAALAELRAFRALADADVEQFVQAFASAIQARLSGDPRFEPLPTRPIDRSAIGAGQGWDRLPTIFPFLLRQTAGACLSAAATESVYRSVMGGGPGGAPGARLGQPVSCGERDGAPISALRLCNSARLIVEGVRDPDAVIGRALAVLDRAGDVAERMTHAVRMYSW